MNAAEVLKQRLGAGSPKFGIVLGSGLGALGDHVSEAIRIPYADLPGFPQTTVSGHAGELIVGELGGLQVALMRGRAHYYERGDARAMKAPLEALKEIGVKALLLTNAAGSLQPETGPASPMLITDHINFAGANPLIGEEGDGRFVAMENAYDPALTNLLRETAAERGIKLAEGTYMWFSGPSFETPAEIKMASMMGAGAVGMSTVPEVILSRFLGLRIAALSLITNMGAGMADEALSHAHTKEIAAKGAQTMETLVTGFLTHLADGDVAL